jgi:hypothetical protein
LALQARYKLSSDATDIKMQEATVVKTQQVWRVTGLEP